MRIMFEKMNGTGNDFVMIDHREETYKDQLSDLVVNICHRRFGIGADGVILIEKSQIADFKMRIFNADGSEAEMCGNGARCAIKFAKQLNLSTSSGTDRFVFETMEGALVGTILPTGDVEVEMQEPMNLNVNLKLTNSTPEEELSWEVSTLNTGVPHAIVFVPNIEKVDVQSWGKIIREHAHFSPSGTNVNFVQVINSQTISIRTYERGVEAETFACGTGATASAILASLVKKVENPVKVIVKGGTLRIDFERLEVEEAKSIRNVRMQGPATTVFKGEYDYV
ncbi:diaminopimelate epimerase [PVC group bacterium (ex Bugula neritina AB1)]|nr:diaminopimelate epimerase [PVC group bacterium (ex Bugula neritina AB1)]